MMMNSSSNKIDALLTSPRTEDHVAALYLSNQLLSSTSSASASVTHSQRASLLRRVLHRLPPLSLLRLCRALPLQQQLNPHILSHIHIQRAVLVFLSHCCSDSALARDRVLAAERELCEWFVDCTASPSPSISPSPSTSTSASTSVSDSASSAMLAHDIATVLKYLAIACGNEATLRIMHSLLNACECGTKTKAPHQILTLFADLLSTISGGEATRLSDSAAVTLRSLVIQGLHGAAPTSVRDATLKSCLTFLQSQAVLHPSWTCAALSSSAAPKIEDSQKVKLGGSFPSFLCSIVYGELHLCEEELLHFASQKAPEEEGRFDATRNSRCYRVFVTCVDLVELMLSLILCDDEGNIDNDDTNKKDNDLGALWAMLSPFELQALQSNLTKLVMELLEFLIESSKLMSTACRFPEVSTFSAAQAILRAAMTKSLICIRTFCFEDSDIRVALQSQFAHIVDGSPMVHIYNHEDMSLTRPSLSCMSLLSATLQVDKNGLISTVPVVSSTSLCEYSGYNVMQEMDIMFHLIVLIEVFLRDIVVSQMSVNEGSNSLEASFDEEAEEMLDAILRIASKLFTLPLILIQLIQDCEFDTVVVSDLLLLLEKSLGVICDLLRAKDREIKILLRAEGERAFQQVIQLPGPYVIALYTAIKNASLGSFGNIESIKEEMENLIAIIESYTELELALSSVE